MSITINGRIGLILLLILAIVYGLSLLLAFALPAALVGAVLVLGAVLYLVGV
jgi:hypothetical protein